MMQRYRAILHLIDPLVEAGHKLVIEVHCDGLNLAELRSHPTNIAYGTSKGIDYLRRNFGMHIENFEKVKFRANASRGDIELRLENYPHIKHNVRIPYNAHSMFFEDKEHVVGNPLSECIRKALYKEVPDSLLIVHPGGGRGFVSPVRKKIRKSKVIYNNIVFLNEVLKNVPAHIKTIKIKTHPFPYHKCTASSMIEHVQPHLIRDVEIVEENLIQHMAETEWLMNFSSTTGIWLTGSPKKIINVVDSALYGGEHFRESHADERGGSILCGDIEAAMANYKSPWTDKDRELWELDAVSNIMEKLNERI